MHLYQTMKNFLMDQNYFIDMWKDYLHVYGFTDIETLGEQKIILKIEDFSLKIEGENFRVLKLTKEEILLQGKVKELKVIS